MSLTTQILVEFDRLNRRIEAQQTQIAALRDELTTTDHLLEARQNVINRIPNCPAHGPGCLPWCIEWIDAKSERSDHA